MAAWKRKGDELQAKLEAKKNCLNKGEENEDKLEQKQTMNKHEYFDHVYKSKTASDIMFEWLLFKKRFPPTMLDDEAEIICKDVKKALKIDTIFKNMMINECNPSYKQQSIETPILDALSCKLGYSLNFLCPPTKQCLLCGKGLIRNHDAIQIPLHDLSGPNQFTKYIWRCKACKGMWKLLAVENNHAAYVTGDVSYHPDMYGTPNNMKFYPTSLQVNVTRASNYVYFSSLSVAAYFSEFHHGWLSAETKAESYNETHRGSHNCKKMDRFALFHPKSMVHFEKKSIADEIVVEHDEDGNDFEDDVKSHETMSRSWEMKRKSLKQALYYHQIQKELVERNMIEKKSFGGKGMTLAQSANNFMVEIDDMMTNELYEHLPKNCSSACEKRGCRWVIVVDGLWKLSYPICMWNNKFAYPQDIVQYLPNVCPEQPAHRKAFCAKHCKVVESLKKPSGLREFLKHCGADPNAYSIEGKSKVQNVLDSMSMKIPPNHNDKTFADVQGTGYLLRTKGISNQMNFKVVKDDEEEEDCRKDIGEVVKLQIRSRGYEAFVTGGGIIKKIWPIYKSEGPTQVALLIIRFLFLYLKDVDPQLWNQLFLSFDNMCHIDSLKLLKNPLELEGPEMPYLWSKIQKVIDPLHIKNHKRKSCHERYNPEKVKESFPEANMMVCEQTFAWLGRFKKVLNSTPKVAAHFLIHRLVLARNRYTELCYKENRRPLWPRLPTTDEVATHHKYFNQWIL